MKLSKHSKIRMRERTEFNHNERKMLFRNALSNGKSAGQIKDINIRNFLYSKEKRCKAKLYKNYVFIYSKNGKQLYTMYKLPDKYLKGSE